MTVAKMKNTPKIAKYTAEATPMLGNSKKDIFRRLNGSESVRINDDYIELQGIDDGFIQLIRAARIN